MNLKHISKIAGELKIKEQQARAAAELLASDATVPFIARYRKEATGGLDEVAVLSIRDQLEQLAAMDKRREAILKSLQEQGVLTEDLKKKISAADTLTVLEDIYLPFRPKRRTRATIAKEKGLEPLAELVFGQRIQNVLVEAAKFMDPVKDVNDPQEALAGARDIMAEWVSENADARADLRRLYEDKAIIFCRVTKSGKELGVKYKDYFDWHEPQKNIPSHRLLAIRRGEKEGVLTVHVRPEESEALDMLGRRFVFSRNAASGEVRTSVNDSYSRLLHPSLENEMQQESKRRADEDAIRVFSENLKEILLAPPLGQKNVLALDPGYRTGCKLVCLDRQGMLLHSDTIYPLEPQTRKTEAAKTIKGLVLMFDIEALAVGNGTGGREAFSFCRGLGLDPRISITLVNESGASVYSASEIAREEFPDQDVTVRGAVSIGRRLLDPLSELVKIDPKSIGVGQYQHDVDQKALKKALDDTVMSCVNAVGVEVNTAGKQLLSYVSGLGPKLAAAIVHFRNEQGPFVSRAELKKVPGLGAKKFEQAVGFLRVRQGDNPLDASAVHPESYGIVESMAADLGCSVRDLLQRPDLRRSVRLQDYVSQNTGMPTLLDIMDELAKPGRDPRPEFDAVAFAEGISEPADLKPGMQLPGIVTNVTNFGAFVDVGVHQDGLVHISQLADRYVARTSDVVKVGQKVSVRVLEVDLERRRIALSMRS